MYFVTRVLFRNSALVSLLAILVGRWNSNLRLPHRCLRHSRAFQSLSGFFAYTFIDYVFFLCFIAQREWLTIWSDNKLSPDPGLMVYLSVYLGFSLLQTIAMLTRQFMYFLPVL